MRGSPSRRSRRSATARRFPTSTNGTWRTSIRPTRRGARRRTSSPSDLPQLRQFKGKLASSASTLADALDKHVRVRQGAVAALRVRQHARRPGHARLRRTRACSRRWCSSRPTFSATASFIEPEILKTDKATIEKFLAAEPRLKVYTFYLDDMLRRAAHTLTDAEEKLLADAGAAAPASASNAFNILSNADFPYPTRHAERRQDGQGRSGGLRRPARAAQPRRPREGDVGLLQQRSAAFSRTFGTTMNGEVQKVLFFAKARKYPSALEATLDGPNIPTSVYTRLVDGVNKNLPAFHRYLKLRKRMMGVDQLHYYDLYAPLVGVGRISKYTPEEAQKLVLGGRRAARPRVPGDDSARVRQPLDRSVSDRRQAVGRLLERRRLRRPPVHADQLQRPVRRRQHAGARAGPHDAELFLEQDAAVSAGRLSDLRRRGRVDVQRVAAHRLHARRTSRTTTRGCRCSATTSRTSRARCSARRSSPSSSCGCTRWRRRASRSPATRSRSCTWTSRSSYYGHDQGVCIVDDYIAHEWSYIPHFYRDFYVFQYATSFTASAALAREGQGGRSRRDEALPGVPRAGGSKYPIDLLKDAGVDMTTDEPLDLTMKEMNRVMDEMERSSRVASSVGLPPSPKASEDKCAAGGGRPSGRP